MEPFSRRSNALVAYKLRPPGYKLFPASKRLRKKYSPITQVACRGKVTVKTVPAAALLRKLTVPPR